MQIGLEGANGVLGGLVAARLAALGEDVVAVDRRRGPVPDDVVALVLATPQDVARGAAVPTIAAALDSSACDEVDVPTAGWFGGLGTLLADVALEAAQDPRELHVAYGLPGTRGAYGRLSPTLRTALLQVAMGGGTARIDARQVEDPLGEGRRLAWFPAPVGPAHAVAVPGVEAAAPLGVATVRTWFAAGSMTAEWLQAVGRADPDRGLGALLARRAAGGGTREHGTGSMRWAVVVEVRDGERGVVRAWANGTDPIAAAADQLAFGARRLGRATAPLTTGTVLDLGPAQEQLDELADHGTLRWSLSRPEPARR